MFEDSFLDSFMESHIGGWTADTERMYDEDEYDDGFYDEDDERMENADLDFVQSDYI
jgi:hypothetical protein